MTRNEEIEKALRKFVKACNHAPPVKVFGYLANACQTAEAALALPEDSKTVNAELRAMELEFADTFARQEVESLCRYELGTGERICVARKDFYEADLARALRYLELREASGEPMPYRVVRDGDKVRFE